MRISVLTICRNDLDGLRRTIESVERQSRRPDEHIVLDGASSDGTVAFLESGRMASTWRSEPDGGIADAFNKVAGMATGDWVLFLNAGDEFEGPKVLEDMAQELERLPETVGVCFGDAIVVDPSGLEQDRRLRGSDDLGHGTNPICHQAAFIRRELQLSCRYDTRMRIGMDYDLWQRLAKRTQFAHVDRAVCLYRLGGISSSRAWGEHCIVAHQMVDWLNAGDRRFGIADAALLLLRLLSYRGKKVLQRLFGERAYAALKCRLSRSE